jgi:hypothetical protein
MFSIATEQNQERLIADEWVCLIVDPATAHRDAKNVLTFLGFVPSKIFIFFEIIEKSKFSNSIIIINFWNILFIQVVETLFNVRRIHS